ncbi:MAG: polysaccharide deacetylase family protein [Anaerolineales bacterium]
MRWRFATSLALGLAASAVLLVGCTGRSRLEGLSRQTPERTAIPPAVSPTPSWAPTPSETTEILPTPTPTLLATPSPDATLQAVLCAPPPVYSPGRHQLLAPILLYHHVGEEQLQSGDESTSRYDVTPADFKAELEMLQELGYHTVRVSQIAAALLGQGTLPQRPIAISFDDGWVDEFQTIFPLLQENGDVGTFYIPSTYPGAPGTVTWADLKEMASAGMEIGSHSRTHGHLASMAHTQAWAEVRLSKVDLEKALGVTVDTFAYPYGEFSPDLGRMVSEAGYHAAVGLGPSPLQGLDNIFYLNRIEVQGSESLAAFLKILPWRGEDTGLCPSR